MEVTCSVEDCEKVVQAKGWCSMHLSRWYRHGDLDYHRAERPACTMPGCEEPNLARGRCEKHYQQWRYRNAKRPPCSIEGCETPVQARGWCPTHYQRWKVHGDPMGGTHQRTHCAICPRRHSAKGLCHLHYLRWRRWDDPWFDGSNYPECKTNGCYRAKHSFGYCPSHYRRWQKYGDPLAGEPGLWMENLPAEPLLEAFRQRGGYDMVLRRLDLDELSYERLSQRLNRAQRRGHLDLAHADEFACSVLGLHPALIWPEDYWPENIDDIEEDMAA